MKTADMIKIMNEHAMFFTERGLYENEMNKVNGSLRNIRYCQAFGDIGFVRCNICLVDFTINEKIRQFPQCDHLFHQKCLDLWLLVDPKCPNCQRTFSPQPTDPTSEVSTLKILRDDSRVHPDLLRNASDSP